MQPREMPENSDNTSRIPRQTGGRSCQTDGYDTTKFLESQAFTQQLRQMDQIFTISYQIDTLR